MTRPRLLVGLLLLVGTVAGCGGDDEKKRKKGSTETSTTRTIAEEQQTTLGGAQPSFTETTAVAPSPGIGTTGSSGIVRPFAINSPWNTEIQSADVDPDSDAMMLAARERVGATDVGTGGSTASDETRERTLDDPLFINLNRWTTPVVDETEGVSTPVFCRQPPLPPRDEAVQSIPDERALCGDGWRVSSLLIPPDESPHPEYDGWFTVLNRREGLAYDLWRARRAADGGSLSYQFMRIWDLNGPGFLAPNRVSARGSGLPLFAGLILPEEIEAGRIDHALAISVPAPAQRVYVQPASSTDGIGRTDSLPEGARIRLKRNVTLRSIQRRFVDARCNGPLFGLRDGSRRRRCQRFEFADGVNQKAAAAIITALHRYGAIVVDRSRVPTLYGKFNADWNKPLRGEDGQLLDSRGNPFPRGVRRTVTPLLRGNELQGIRLSDFEVTRVGQLFRFPDLSAVTVEPLPGGAVGERGTTTTARGARTTTNPSAQQTFSPPTGTNTTGATTTTEAGG